MEDKPVRILYVDDYPYDRQLVRHILEIEHGGFAVTEAVNREEFETRLAAEHFDLVLTDFNIAGYEGLQVLDHVKFRRPSLPVIILTGTGSEEVAVEALRRGAADYVIKTPRHIDRLPFIIKTVFQRTHAEEQQRRLLQILEATPDFIGIASLDEHITFLNQAARRLMGIGDGDYRQIKISDFHPRWAYEIIKNEGIPSAIRNGTWFGETALLNQAGQEIPVSQVIISHRTTSGDLDYLSTVARDISVLKQTEEELRQTGQQLNEALLVQTSILDALPAHIALLDEEGIVRAVNARWRHFAIENDYPGDTFGLGVDYIALCEQAEGYCAELAREVATGIRAVLSGDQANFNLEYPCHSPDEQRWFRVMVSSLKQDKPRGVVVMHVDVTARRLAEEALKASEARFKSIADNLPGYICRWTRQPDGHVNFEYISTSIQRLFGLDPERIVTNGGLLAHAMHPDDRKTFEEALTRSAWESTPLDVEHRLQLPSGETCWVRSLARPQPQPDGSIRWDGIGLDITDKKEAEAQSEYLIYNDPLTGLPNRVLLEDRLQQAIGQTHRHRWLVALYHLDLDNFKEINDTQGHSRGDMLLRAVSERLSDSLRLSDTVARLGSDEFGIIQTEVKDLEQATALARKLLDNLARPFDLAGETITISASVGIALHPDDPDKQHPSSVTPKELLKQADIALHEAKLTGRNTYRLYHKDLEATAQSRMILRQALHRALDNQEFQLHYQPQIEIASGRIIGAEALLRWPHPKMGMQRPDQFIPLAEETGLILPIGRWVLLEACNQAITWQQQGLAPITMAVNVSIVQLQRDRLVDTVRQVLEATGLEPQWLKLELTENIMAVNSPYLLTTLEGLRNMGIKLAIDDFGTGYASFQYLKNFPIDELKIDQIFIRHLTRKSTDAALVRAMLAVAESLGMPVVAEGVETLEQWQFLHHEGCAKAQGYYFSPPLLAEDFTWLLQENKRLPLNRPAI